jgi:hypothetical protein
VISKYANAHLGLGPSFIWAAFPSVGGLIVAALAAGTRPEILLAAGTLLVVLGQGCFAVNAITLRQLNSIPSMRAQATSVHRFLSWGALPVGALIAGALGQFLGLRVAMLASGIVAGRASFRCSRRCDAGRLRIPPRRWSPMSANEVGRCRFVSRRESSHLGSVPVRRRSRTGRLE